MLLDPETWLGWNEDGEHIYTVNAANATEIIDPTAIEAAASKVISTIEEQIGEISTSFKNMSQESLNSINVQGINLQEIVDGIIEGVEEIKSSMVEAINGLNLKDEAIKLHDQIQKQYNSDAESDCWAHAHHATKAK